MTEEAREATRQAWLQKLQAAPFLKHKDPLFMHGRGYADGPAAEDPRSAPRKTWCSARPPRDDHDAPRWLTASEYSDQAEVMGAKVQQLAQLLRISRKTVIYTGAGISASVIGQAARSGLNKQGWKGGRHTVPPTFTHQALGWLCEQGLAQSWVQQNHDGLPQKAGVPQEVINEIHGSWYDPSNPVVKYSGSLHDDLEPRMVEDSETADLVLVLGTSLGGLYADDVAVETAQRSRNGRSLGACMINLQQTDQDGKMSLRLFGRSDEVMRLLLAELGMGNPRFRPPVWPTERKVLVPYDAQGRRIEAGGGRRMWWDLSDRANVRITPGHNIQGARQPCYLHIGGKDRKYHLRVISMATGIMI